MGVVASQTVEALERTLVTLSHDEAPAVREQSAVTLAQLLEDLDGVTRTRIVSEWAASPDPRQRAAVAGALRDPIPIVGSLSALRALAADNYVDVRKPAYEAMACRISEAPEIYSRALARGARDPYPHARVVCVHALQKAAELGVVAAFDALAEIADDDDPALASLACDALAAAAATDPELAGHELELVTLHPEDRDPEVLAHLVIDALRVGTMATDRAIATLLRIVERPEPWLRQDAIDAIAQLVHLRSGS